MSVATCERVDAKGKVCGGEIEDGVCGKCGRPQQKGILMVASPGTATKARGGTGTVGQGRSGSGRVSRRQSSGSTTSRRQSLGGGLVSLPPVPSQDPERQVMVNPEVPPSKRHCPHCNARVSRLNGFCPQCSAGYDFRPSLKAGDLVGGKYEIRGPIGLGGMGWIYLAQDVVLKRWVVLKGVLNAGDPEAAAAAVAERQFLAAVKDARIVSIYDFIAHGSQGYMVLEYVGGRTVDDIRADGDVVDVLDDDGKVLRSGAVRRDLSPDERRRTIQVTRFGTLPPEQAVSYVLAILPAFSYLHAQGFTHNDMKPDNVMVEGDSVKLLDLGAMRRIADQGGTIFGTDGFFAPEAEDGPVAVSDLYSVGRTLAVLLMDFLYKVKADRDATTKRVTTRRMLVSGYKQALPSQAEQPVLARNDSLYRFMLRATHEDPDQRFQSADEMEGQLFGILREIMAAKTGPKPAESKVFLPDGLVDGHDRPGAAAPLPRLLPGLRVDPSDKAANEILGLAAVVDPRKRLEALMALAAKRKASVEARLRSADAWVGVALAEGTGADEARAALDSAVVLTDQVLRDNEFEWRAHWYAGKALLAAGRAGEALSRFDRVYFEMPGELAPRLAMAFAAEAGNQPRRAAELYGRVAMVDPAYASACFGLARSRARLADPDGAAEALEAVPPAHSLYPESRTTLARTLIDAGVDASGDRLDRAALAIGQVTHKDGTAERLSAQLFLKAVDLIVAGKRKPEPKGTLLGMPGDLDGMRKGAERAFLGAARKAADASERALWIDMAAEIRPRSLG